MPTGALLAVGVASLGEPHRDLTLAAPSYVRALGDGVLDVIGPERYRRAFGDRRTTAAGPIAGDLMVDLGWDAAEPPSGSGQLIAEHRPSPELLRVREQMQDRLVGVPRDSGDLPLWGMASTEEAEVRRWLREDLDGFLPARLVPHDLASAPETRRYLRLRREPVLHASVHLVPAG